MYLDISISKSFLAAVRHVQEPVLILEGFIDSVHQTRCKTCVKNISRLSGQKPSCNESTEDMNQVI